MELVKNIFFNTDKLISNSTVKISYAGYLFQNNSEEVFFHYGFGENWEQVNDIPMKKTELGFQCEVDIPDTDSFHFCFHNNTGVWDNNFGQNFSFPVEKVEKKQNPIEENKEEYALITTTQPEMIVHKGLKKSYIWSKKIRLAIYKLIHYLPKIVSGNYKRKIEE